MADKRISDLEITTTLKENALFHVRNAETNEDFKITKSDLVKAIGNPVITGFVATTYSISLNQIYLDPVNNGFLDQYYNGMVVTFISPTNFTSSDLFPKIKIGSLNLVPVYYNNIVNPYTTFPDRPVFKFNQVYQFIYNNNYLQSLSPAFVLINPDIVPTNEYLSVAEIIFDNLTEEYFTLYTLTSATSYYKKEYYNRMSIIFSSGIINNSVENMSRGKIYVNVDGLGRKLLSDPDGDGVPFSLQLNETILGIYDGEKFIKNMFTMQEPELPVPVDPVNPPPGYDITLYVGPDELEKSNRLLQTAYERIIKDFGHNGGGRKVLIKFRDNYTGQGLKIVSLRGGNFQRTDTFNTGYITFEGNPNVIMLRGFTCLADQYGSENNGLLKLTGTWKCRFPEVGVNVSDEYCFIENSMNVSIKDALIENENVGNQNFYFYKTISVSSGTAMIGRGNLSLENVELKNFGAINSFYTYNDQTNFTFYNVVITNTISQVRIFNKIFFQIMGNFSIDGLQINITKPSNYNQTSNAGLIKIDGPSNRLNFVINLKNCNIVLNNILTMPIIYIQDHAGRQGTNEGIYYGFNVNFEDCVVKYNSTLNNTKQSILYKSSLNTLSATFSTLTILGNDFGNKNTATIADILIDNGKLTIRSNTTIGSTSAINGGQIINV